MMPSSKWPNDPIKLIFFNQAKKALEFAATIDEIKGIGNKAEAMSLYVKQVGESLVMQNHCAEMSDKILSARPCCLEVKFKRMGEGYHL